MDGLYVMKWDYRFLFGKYKSRRVDEVFANDWYGKSYIAWVYYNKPDVTFSEEILSAVEIKDRIKKPGAVAEKYSEWINSLPQDVGEMISEYSRRCAMGKASHNRSAIQKLYKVRVGRDNHEAGIEFSKGRLAWKN